jgi:PPOX class probable F420-dependent enzyme
MTGIPEEARALLTSEPLVAHLATCADGGPHVAPLWFAVHDDHVELLTTGRKLENIRSNPRVALSVQKDEGGADPQWAVTLRGTAEIVDDEAEADAIRERVHGHYGVAADEWPENVAVSIAVGSVNYWSY